MREPVGLAEVLTFIANSIAAMTGRQREDRCLRPGSRVLDIGCGTGASFPFLVQAVGSEGEVVGVDISPDLVSIAQKRTEKAGWNNVHIAVGPAHHIALPGTFDGMLLFAVHEVLTSPEALDHVLPYLKKGARVVAFGAKLSHSRRVRLLTACFACSHKPCCRHQVPQWMIVPGDCWMIEPESFTSKNGWRPAVPGLGIPAQRLSSVGQPAAHGASIVSSKLFPSMLTWPEADR